MEIYVEKDLELFRGHLDECLRHLNELIAPKAPKGTREAVIAHQPIANFCGVTAQTVTTWLYGASTIPCGERLFRLMFYLDMIGYRVIELEEMPGSVRGFAELIVFRILTSEQARVQAGYANVSRLFEIFRGAVGVSEERSSRMWETWKERKEELKKAKEEAKKRYHMPILSMPSGLSASTPVSGMEHRSIAIWPVTNEPSGRSPVLSIMQALLDLLKGSSVRSFDKLSESDLLDLRGSASMVFELLAHLNALGSQLIVLGSQEQKKEE